MSEICAYCHKEFDLSFRRESAPNRKSFTCSHSCGVQYAKGFVKCQSCNKRRMKRNQITCNYCHKNCKPIPIEVRKIAK